MQRNSFAISAIGLVITPHRVKAIIIQHSDNHKVFIVPPVKSGVNRGASRIEEQFHRLSANIC